MEAALGCNHSIPSKTLRTPNELRHPQGTEVTLSLMKGASQGCEPATTGFGGNRSPSSSGWPYLPMLILTFCDIGSHYVDMQRTLSDWLHSARFAIGPIPFIVDTVHQCHLSWALGLELHHLA